MTNAFAIIVAGGQSRRFYAEGQNTDLTLKQFLPLGQNKTVIDHAIERIKPLVDDVVLVVPEGYEDTYAERYSHVITGGHSRTESVYKGLSYIHASFQTQDKTSVLIHDAARPFPPTAAISEMLHGLRAGNFESSTLAIAISDTLLRSDSYDYVDRNNLHAIQTPQGFVFKKLYEAHKNATDTIKSKTFTDDTTLFNDSYNIAPTLIQGSADNFKITYNHDYERAKRMIENSLIPRIGQGFDVHAFEAKENSESAVRLGGIDIPHPFTLKGHSDADVVLHTITDALLGTLALGDIGQHFPPSNPKFKNMDSAVFLQKACALLREKQAKISNIDLTIICEAPKISPHIEAMQKRISEICEIKQHQISIKATTTEKLGFTGRKEGIAAQAVACILIPMEAS